MLRVAYRESLEATEGELGTLGALMMDALKHAVKAVETRDAALSARIIAGADQTAEMARRVQQACIELIWRQQPLAGEMRRVTAMFEMSTDLERINHYITDIAKHAVRLADSAVEPPHVATREVAGLTQENLRRAVESYAKRDLDGARSVLADDESFETSYSTGIRALQEAIRANPDVLAPATELLFVLTSLQRVGEHAASIAWHTEEMLTGETPAA
jgi:phosphate transport system protein